MQDQKYGFIIFCNLFNSTIEDSSSSVDFSIIEGITLTVKSDLACEGVICMEEENSYSNVPLKDTLRIKIISKGYKTYQQALDIGQNVLTTLKLLGIKKKIGVVADTSNRVVSKSHVNLHLFDHLAEKYAKEHNVHIFNIDGSNPGLSIFPLDKELSIVKSGGVSLKISSNTQEFINSMADLYPLSKTNLNDKERLAIDLYLSAQHERTIEAKFLFLINTVECLPKEKDQEEDILDYIKLVLDDMEKKFPKEDKKYKPIFSGMQRLKKKSIGQRCKELIEKYLGEIESKEFAKYYGIRSDIVHKGHSSPKVNLSESLTNLNDLVSRLLLAIIKSKNK